MSKADTLEEFVRSYATSYVGLKVPGLPKIYPAKILDQLRVANGILPLQYLVDGTGKTDNTEIRWANDKNRLLREFPNLGMVKAGPTVGYLSVAPLRQWHKGYVPDNIRIYVPNLSDIKQHKTNLWFSSGARGVIWQVYNREFWTIQEAIKNIEEGNGVGYPLSENFGLFCSIDYENPLLLYKKDTIGSVESEFMEPMYSHITIKLMDTYEAYKEQIQRELGKNLEVSVCHQ